MLQGIRRPPGLGPVLAHHAGHQRRALLEVVRRRPDQRLLQLRRPPLGPAQEQGGDSFRSRTGRRGAVRHHLPGTLRQGERIRPGAEGVLRPQGRRPGDPAHADDARPAGHHAGLRPARHHPLRGVRRVQRPGLRRPDSRFRQPRADHHRRLSPQRLAARPQAERRHRRRDRQEARPEGRQGIDLAALSRKIFIRVEAQEGPRFHRQRRAQGFRRPQDRPGVAAGGRPAVPDVHQRDHGQAQGLPAQHRRVYVLCRRDLEIHPGHPSRGCLLVHGGHRLDHRPFLYRLRAAGARRLERDVRGRADLPRPGTGVAHRRAARRQHLPHRADDDPHAAQGRPRRAARNTTIISST